MKKAIFFDMDGTLLYKKAETESPIISEETKKALQEVKAKGNLIFIATGRPLAFLTKEVMDIGFSGYILANGAVIMVDEQVVKNTPLNQIKLKKILDELDKKNIEYILQTKSKSYMKNDAINLINFYNYCGVDFDMIENDFILDEIIDEVVKVEMLPTTNENIDFCQSLEDDDFNLMGHPPYTFELYARDVSKATGIKEMLEIMEIDLQHTYAFGDGKNDIEMLQLVNCGIAMDNASEEVKQHANLVCGSATQEGVSKMLKQLEI